jgi:hypothetical protein
MTDPSPAESTRPLKVLQKNAPVLILVLSVAALVSQTLAISATKLQPRYDEVAYIAIARSYQRLGGVVGTVRCHLQGLCQEDNRSPLFEIVLQTIASDDTGFYAVAKLVTLGTTLLLGLLGAFLARRYFGSLVAAGVIAIWCLMPSLGELSSRIMPDPLFAAIILAGVYAIAACQGAGVLAWVGTGALIGIAFLTKGNGHLLFPALFCVGFHHYGRSFLRRLEPYAAVLAFLVVTAFLIRRNMIVFHSPLHNFNERLLWLDNWEESWAFLRDPEKYTIGLGFLMKRHSIWDLALRGIKGLGETIGVMIYGAGLGVTSLKAPEAPMTAAIAIPRAVTGFLMVASGTLGLRRSLGTPNGRVRGLAVSYTLAWFIAAFALGQQGAGEIGVRYVMPLVILLTPYAVEFSLAEIWPRLQTWLSARSSRLQAPGATETMAVAVLAALLVTKLAWFAPAAAGDPRRFVQVPAQWARTSQWFSQHLTPGERYAFPYTSLYSTFDQPFPEPDQRWIYLYRLDAAVMKRDLDRGVRSSIDASLVGPPGPIDKVLVDMQDSLLASYQDKLSNPHDAQGPLAFLDWPRCFADGETPSRFLVYCRRPVP